MQIGKERSMLAGLAALNGFSCIKMPKESIGPCDYKSEIRKSIMLNKKAVDVKKYSGLLICGDFSFWYD